MTTQQPRIYTYKVTFVNAPFWYWGVHKEERYGECYFGTPVTHKWAWEFYEPEIQILELFPYTDEGWEEACEVEKRLIRPDLNKEGCLNENCGGYFSLEVLRKMAREGAKKAGKASMAKRTKEEKVVSAKKAGAAAKLVHQKKIELTRILDKVTFVFDSKNDACRDLNLNSGNLGQVCLGKRKTHKGFTARYLT